MATKITKRLFFTSQLLDTVVFLPQFLNTIDRVQGVKNASTKETTGISVPFTSREKLNPFAAAAAAAAQRANSLIECELFNYTLRIGSGSPQPHPYQALSYAWGSPKPADVILVNGEAFPVTAHQ